jgi:hypothetical protein
VINSFNLRKRVMQKLLQGLQHFQTNIFGTQRELLSVDWVFKIETVEVYGFDPEICQFKVLTEQRKTLSLPDQKFVAQEI